MVQNGGARLAPELRARLRQEFGCTPQEIYGTAEGLINMTRLDDPDDLLLESSGAPVSEFDEIAVLDDAGQRGARRRAGRAGHARAVHHPRLLQRPDEQRRGVHAPTASTAWATSSGSAAATSTPKGRRKDLINRGGEKISCDEVENLIFGTRQVRQVSAGRDARSGVRREGVRLRRPPARRGSLTFDELIAHLRAQQIAAFKLPERLEMMTSFPVSPVGKILKRELREIVAQRVAQEAIK